MAMIEQEFYKRNLSNFLAWLKGQIDDGQLVRMEMALGRPEADSRKEVEHLKEFYHDHPMQRKRRFVIVRYELQEIDREEAICLLVEAGLPEIVAKADIRMVDTGVGPE